MSDENPVEQPSAPKFPVTAIIIALVVILGVMWATGLFDAEREAGEGTPAEAGDNPMDDLVDKVRSNSIADVGKPITLRAEDISMIDDPENTFVMQLSTGGPVLIELYPEVAPNHVARFKELVRESFYDGIVFHRVIEGFMAQTGDPTGTGSGGSGQNIDAEFNDIAHERGVVSTARSANPNSADSQFFIMFDSSPGLDGQYTAWGRVIAGMEFVDAITRGPDDNNGVVPGADRDRINSMRVAADIVEGEDEAGEAAEE